VTGAGLGDLVGIALRWFYSQQSGKVTMRRLATFGFLLLLLVAGSLAQGQSVHQHDAAPPAEASPTVSSNTSFDAQMTEAMERMHTAMAAMRSTGRPESDFLAAMIPHHQGAIDMAKAVLLVAQDPRIRNLAQSIITEQQYEIELMKTLLAESRPQSPSTPEKQP
jgi:uncharacterized protein (DUF305 family)